jgi:hypothetical protein
VSRLILLFILFIFLIPGSLWSQELIVLQTDDLEMRINPEGNIAWLGNRKTGQNYLFADSLAPILSLRVNGEFRFPVKADFLADSNLLRLHFDDERLLWVRIHCKKTFLSMELIDADGVDQIDLITWGPIPLTLNSSIAETVGVASGDNFAVGIQALNMKTLGGYPWNENDCMPQIDIFDQGDYSDMSESNKRYVLYRVEAAKPASFGSTLQAYCRNRDHERLIYNWEHEGYVSPAIQDGGIIGSKIALFGCQPGNVLNTIGEIEIGEGLPHPMIDGVWGKQSLSASAAYLILPFNEQNIDSALSITRKAGLRYLYHPDPFRTWGHFELDSASFPHGLEGMKSCVEKAANQDIMLGVHVLSNFITTNDPYVTPAPDQRLAKVGSSRINDNISPAQTEIPVESSYYFSQSANNNLKTVQIGKELIQYDSVSPIAPFKLLHCLRGAFGTTSSVHAAGEKIILLADHGYKVFLTDPELSIEMATRLSDLFNKTGLRQLSFDGLEGNRSTGLGNYGEILFTNTWYEHLKPSIREHYIADASRTSHFFWHIYTRMNWGEPWYAGFRESQTDYRLKNQAYFKRNYMPGMLGWFSMRPSTSPEDIEWMLARSAAFNAGYAFCTDFSTLKQNGMSEEILHLLNIWEKARLSAVFTEQDRKLMEDIRNEFTMKELNDDGWELTRILSTKFHLTNAENPALDSLSEKVGFDNPYTNRTIQFLITARKEEFSNLRIRFDQQPVIDIPLVLKSGYSLKYQGGDAITLYDERWNRLSELPVRQELLSITSGKHDMMISGKGSEVDLFVEVRIPGDPTLRPLLNPKR